MIHPEIYSPNDILSLGPTSFLVTNDHLTQKHGWRTLEEVFNLRWTSWTNVVRVDLTSTGEVQVETVLAKEHNANGLAWGPDGEIMLVDASGGVISRLSALPSGKLSVIDRVQLDTTLDNQPILLPRQLRHAPAQRVRLHPPRLDAGASTSTRLVAIRTV